MAQGSRRRGRIFIYLALILILGLVLVWLVLNGGLFPSVSQQQPTTVAEQEMVDVVFTTQKVTRGDYFTEDVLTTSSLPKNVLTDGTYISSTATVLGKRASNDIESGVMVSPSAAVDTVTTAQSSFQIPTGMVALAIPINKLTSVSYAPQTGDHVNVIVSMLFVDLDPNFQTQLPNNASVVTSPISPEITMGITPSGAAGRAEGDGSLGQTIYLTPSEEQRARLVSQTLIQDAIVLHVGDFETAAETAAAQATAEEGATEETQPTVTKPDTITLVVTPQNAVTLNYLVNSGAQLTLALRSAGDDQQVQTESVTLQYLLDNYGISVPAKLSVGTDPRVDSLINPLYDVSPE